MKFKLPTHKPSGQAREAEITLSHLSVNVKQNLLDDKGNVSFSGETKMEGLPFIQPDTAMPGMENQPKQTDKEKAAIETLREEICTAYGKYYTSTLKDA